MPTHQCPKCPQTALRYLPINSQQSYFNYYRCDGCGHVFTVAKSDPDAPLDQITAGR